MLALRSVGKRYPGGEPVLSGIDLELRRGEVLGVIGTNGSGKSTLLRILAGVSEPSAGIIDGRPRVGYLPDRFPAATRMSAMAYLRHLGRISGLSEIDGRAAGLLTRLALAGGPGAPLRQLSKGNAQKVGLAQALLAEPELLVLDEPWSGLDKDTHGVLGEILAEARERDLSVVFTDHRAEVARAHATRVLRLSGGVLGPADEHRDSGGSGERARILLRGPGSGDWRTEPGLVVVADGDDRCELTVPAERCDAVLLLALRRGWSVLSVRTPVAK
nr:ABC transporter ATP-binding protein [Amycolatopsis nigrescens]